MNPQNYDSEIEGGSDVKDRATWCQDPLKDRPFYFLNQTVSSENLDSLDIDHLVSASLF